MFEHLVMFNHLFWPICKILQTWTLPAPTCRSKLSRPPWKHVHTVERKSIRFFVVVSLGRHEGPPQTGSIPKVAGCIPVLAPPLPLSGVLHAGNKYGEHSLPHTGVLQTAGLRPPTISEERYLYKLIILHNSHQLTSVGTVKIFRMVLWCSTMTYWWLSKYISSHAYLYLKHADFCELRKYKLLLHVGELTVVSSKPHWRTDVVDKQPETVCILSSSASTNWSHTSQISV